MTNPWFKNIDMLHCKLKTLKKLQCEIMFSDRNIQNNIISQDHVEEC